MDDVLFARSQMGMSLAFHIVFACVGIAMPVLMVVAEVLYRRRGDEQYLQLAKLWSRGTAVLFAVGAVSGTVLSFELGLLFPEFMRHAGPVIGMPFSLEGFAFFIEAIFLGLYLYGWRLLSPALHVFSGVMVALSGLLSAVFVTIVNAWMNAPRGFRVENGVFVDIDPLAAMANPFAVHEVLHMAVAAYMATAFAAAALHAWALLRNPGSGLHRKALAISLGLAVPMALVQPLIGHYAGQVVAREQPVKLAAMEGLEKTQTHAPIHVGPVRIPAALSILAFNDPAAEVKGLEIVPEADRPHAVVRPAFQLMVLLGTLLAALSVWAGWLWLR
ncbi:MAG: cytochrome ubiquinol oxidase subunit I, partial [Myxococcales bacterium]